MKQFLLLLLFVFSLNASGVSNRFAISNAVFDPDSFTIAMSWSFDTTGIQGVVQGGISVKSGSKADSIPNFLIFFETPLSDTTFFIPELNFDTTYTLEIWQKNENGWIAPDSHAIRTIFIESSTRQPVEFFDPGKKIDTIAILKKTVFLWKDSHYPLSIPPHIDTVVSYTPDPSRLNGLTLAGPGFRFLHPEPTVSFYIGFKIDTNKFDGSHTRIFTDSSGFYRAQNISFYDTLHSIIYTVTSSMKLPFVVLTDTIRPVIRVISDTSSVIDIDVTIDTILVHDNCPGVRWSFFCLSDEDSSSVHAVSNGIVPDTSGMIICKFPFLEFSKNGARAFLSITDGTFQDTIDLSRRSVRPTGDIISTESNFIMPVFTTADIDSPGVRSALKTLFQLSGGTYNNSIFRLYRWAPTGSIAAAPYNWVESSAANEPLFQFKPSSLFWLITKQSVLFELGKGKTSSVKGDLLITLPPKNWTDFSIPYSFGIHLSDVISKTGAAASDVYYYRWVKNDSARSYSANLMFSKPVNGDSCSNILFSNESDGYTAYNPHDTAIQLHFPVYTFNQQHAVTILTKKSSAFSYTLAVKGVSSNGATTTVFCATHLSDDTLYCPPPPSFSTPVISILPGESKQQASIVSYPSDNLSIFKLYLPKTNGNSVTISAEIENSSQPLQYSFLRKTETGFVILSNNAININPQNESVIYLTAADKSTIEKLYPNAQTNNNLSGPAPFKFYKNRITFQFQPSTEQHVLVEFFNLQGKRVQKLSATTLNPSVEVILTSGVYIAKFSTIAANSTQSYVQYQKFSIGRQELFHAQ
ncbi:MAG TPA: T9SS type A sorting domain-containing protein [Chitinispirillaceae bacterium]|nr:T9SS type A sorting domain-containing protein [Chitinispirillaceae bacterium]